MMAVTVDAESSTFRAGTPTALFSVRNRVALQPFYDVSPDGEKFLIARLFGRSENSPLTVELNWDRKADRMLDGR